MNEMSASTKAHMESVKHVSVDRKDMEATRHEAFYEPERKNTALVKSIEWRITLTCVGSWVI